MSELVLSLFPGIGLLDMAFEEHAFCIVRGPDQLWGGNIKQFHPPAGRFDGIIGGPPCQAFSSLRHIVEANGYKTAENLIPEFERCVKEAQPRWFLMENVPAAPAPAVEGYAVSTSLLNNRWFGGEQNRQRAFSFGVQGEHAIDLWGYLLIEALETFAWAPAVLASGSYRSTPRIKIGGNGKVKKTAIAAADVASRRGVIESLRLQGLPEDLLDKAPSTVEGKQRVIGNGVPLPLGRAIAHAIKEILFDNVAGVCEGRTSRETGAGSNPDATATNTNNR